MAGKVSIEALRARLALERAKAAEQTAMPKAIETPSEAKTLSTLDPEKLKILVEKIRSIVLVDFKNLVALDQTAFILENSRPAKNSPFETDKYIYEVYTKIAGVLRSIKSDTSEEDLLKAKQSLSQIIAENEAELVKASKSAAVAR